MVEVYGKKARQINAQDPLHRVESVDVSTDSCAAEEHSCWNG